MVRFLPLYAKLGCSYFDCIRILGVLTLRVLILALVSVLAACAAGNTPTAKISEHLEKGDIKTASQLYSQNKTELAKNQSDVSGLNEELAEAIAKELGPKSMEATTSLESITWPTPPSAWTEIKATMDEAQEIIDEASGYEILEIAETPPREINELESKYTTLKNKMESDAGKQFERYDPLAPKSFFEAYPIDLAGSDVIGQFRWNPNIRTIGPNELVQIQERYSEYVPEHLERQLGQLYFERIVSRYSGDKKTPSAQATLAALRDVSAGGFKMESLEGSKIVVAHSLPSSSSQEFPVKINNDFSFPMVTGGLDTVLSDSKFRDAEIALLVEVTEASIDHQAMGNQSVQSEYKSGSQTVHNPAYSAAQARVNQATINYQQSATQTAITNAQYCYGLGCLAKAAAQIAAAAAQANARNQLEAATSDIANTPATVEKPVYTPYSFNKTTVAVFKSATISYHVVDRQSKRYSGGTHMSRETDNFIVGYGLHPLDRRYSPGTGNMVLETEIEAFEKAPLELDLSDVVSRYASGDAETSGLPSLTALKSRVIDERKQSTKNQARYASVEASRSSDTRFKSAVIVDNPSGSQGAGFFVAPDVVLTNEHVVKDVQYVEIKLFDGERTFGKVTARDYGRDLALIRTQARGQTARFYTGGSLPVGVAVEAIGHPSGLEFSITRGIISAVREIPSSSRSGRGDILLIQTDTPLSPGNSGGPLYLRDRVVGVNSWKIAGEKSEGLGFAVHYAEAMDFLEKQGVQF